LLLPSRIDSTVLVTLPKGQAVAKLEQPDGVRNYVLAFPRAISQELTDTVHAILEQDTDQPTGLSFVPLFPLPCT
jgi:hypothetical protein